MKTGRPVGRRYQEIVSIRLSVDLHNDLSREALRRDKPLSDIMRERLSVSQELPPRVSSAHCP